jgi:hypothetical protein
MARNFGLASTRRLNEELRGIPDDHYLLLKTDGSREYVPSKSVSFTPERPWHGQFQWAQSVPITHTRREDGYCEYHFLCDEEGIRNKRPKNTTASNLLRGHFYGQQLVGPVFIGKVDLGDYEESEDDGEQDAAPRRRRSHHEESLLSFLAEGIE